MAQEMRVACTVVSLVPFGCVESKPGLIPGTFEVKGSDGKVPTCLVVYDARHNVYIDETRGSLGVRDAADEVARSIVEDFLASQLAVSDGCHPGIFWAVGAFTPEKAMVELKDELAAATLAQRRWFIELCKVADNDWNRYHQHNVISDFQRKAAELLGYTKEEHEWMAPSVMMASSTCPACNASVPKGIAVCPSCKCILDKKKYESFEFATK